ncbi:MAG: alpha-2-macroglobulin family protein [Campylobacteraceae bacterium]|nr:alpha-2-macroglobulin family protein [Campylobacteraceae bacterium]
MKSIVGDIKWNSPFWFSYVKKAFKILGNKTLKHYKAIIITFCIVVVASFGSYYGYIWKQNQPKPVDVAPIEYQTYSVRLGLPYATDYSYDKPLVYPLYVYFDGDVAPIENIGKNVTEGISLTPYINGKWSWSSSRTLEFKPESEIDWAIGESYAVKIEPKKLLAEQALISATEYKFATKEFYYAVNDRELYQNPEKPSEKNVIYEVAFSHPVDAASFEKQISLNLIAPEKYKIAPKPYKFAVKYDNKKLKAWIRSEFVTLPEVDSNMVLKIDKGVKSSVGGAAVSNEKISYQEVTSVYRDIVKNIFLTLAENENNEQEQVLAITLVDSVNINDLSKQVKAWILPKDKPKINNNSEVKNYRWSSNDDISSEILAKATPLTLTKDSYETDIQNIVSFRYKVSPKNYIYVEVGSNIETVGGYKAKSGKRAVLSVPEFPQVLLFADSGSILSLKGERKISVASRNVKGVKLDIKRVIPSQLHHLMAFGNYNNFNKASFDNNRHYYDGYDYSEYFTEIFSHTQKINQVNPGKVMYTGIDLTNYLLSGASGKQGVFLVTLNSWNPDTNATGYETISKLVVVTDIGLIIKRSADGSSDIFAQSIKDSMPLENVKISVLGKNGVQLTSATTDISGHVKIKSLQEFKNEKEPAIFIAQKDGDTSFLPAFYDGSGKYGDRRLEFSRFDTGGISNVLEQGRLSAYLFSDRGLYRPGDSVNVGTIVKAENWDIGVGGIPVVATIYDPRGQVFENMPFVLDESGFNEISFTTADASPTGNWIINLSVASNFKDKSKAGIFLGSVNIAVREFEPDRMKVDLKLSPTDIKGWIKPDELQVLVKVENLFGTPAQNRKVSSTLILNPTDFYFNEHKNYHFYDGYRGTWQDKFEIRLEDVSTDDNGEAKLSLLLEEHERASYHLSIITEAFEQGSGRGVSAAAKTIISPNSYLIGAKADGDLGYIKKDTARTLNFIAIEQNLSKITLSNLTLEIVEQRYVSVLTLQNSGVYKYQSKLQEVSVDEQNFNIEKDGTDYLLNSKKPGTYKLLIKNEKGDTLYRSYYGVVGDANIDRSLERNSELEMKLSKGEYKNGDEIEISINTPYIGSGLITIEKDKVYAWKWFKTSTTSSTQKIIVPKELKGNGYINVQFVRDPNSDDIFMSPLSYGVLPFKITMEKESAKVRLSSTKLVKPGEDVDITINTDGKQKVVVFAADEGILQVANYHLTNPLNFFFQKRYLEVNSYQILDLILPEFSKIESLNSAAGGDDYAERASKELNRNLNPFKRKIDKPIVFWSGITEVDGEKSFTYKVPDYFNGKLRVMAVAVSEKQIGIAQTDTTVRDNFVLTPNVPFMAALNDEFEVTLGVSNNLENITKKVPIAISLIASPHVKVLGNSTAVIELAQKSEGYVKFKLKASVLGGGELTFKAVYADKDNQKNYLSQRVGTISVRPVTPFRTQSIMGRMGGDKESIKNIRNMYDEYAIRYASVANTPMALSNGLTSYLDNYPHYCSEQLISSAISAMIQQKYTFLNRANVNKVPYESIAAILKSRQNSNGAISLWTTTAYGDTFVSVYTAHYLIDAKENGITISPDLLENLNGYLANLANDNNIEYLEGLRLRAYAVYLLTRQGVVTTNMLSSVQKSLQTHYENSWKSDVSALYLAATYKMLKMDKEADLLLQKPWSELNKAYDNAWWSRDYYDPLVINSTYIYLISKHFVEKVRDIPPQALENIVLMIRANRFTTTSSAMSILAIESYSKQIENISNAYEKKLSIEALSKGVDASHVIANASGIWAFGDFTKNDAEIIFNNPSKLPAWYSVVEEGYDIAAPKEAIKKGLEVYKEFTDENGKTVTSVKLGEKINVTIRIRSNSNEGVGNVAVVDLLPGGFEIVQQNANQQTEEEYDDEYGYEYDDEYYDSRFISPIEFGETTWGIDYSDIREDRVIIYGTAQTQTKEFIYQIKSTNAGTYQMPPSFAEAMYDREIQAVSANIGNITVLPVE